MAESKEITPKAASAIKHAQPEELSVMTEEVLEVNSVLNDANTELDLLEDAIKQLNYTKMLYDQKSSSARKHMQRLVTKL